MKALDSFNMTNQ